MFSELLKGSFFRARLICFQGCLESHTLAQVVQKLDGAISRLDHYPVDKC